MLAALLGHVLAASADWPPETVCGRKSKLRNAFGQTNTVCVRDCIFSLLCLSNLSPGKVREVSAPSEPLETGWIESPSERAESGQLIVLS